MTSIYEVTVQHPVRPDSTVRVAAKTPMEACCSAEHIVASQWDDFGNLPDYFAGKVRELTCAEFPGFATEPTDQGNQYVIPGCEKDKSRGPSQMDLF